MIIGCYYDALAMPRALPLTPLPRQRFAAEFLPMIELMPPIFSPMLILAITDVTITLYAISTLSSRFIDDYLRHSP